MDAFVNQYLHTMLWASTGNDAEPLSRNYRVSHCAPETVEKAIEDCRKFRDDNAEDLKGLDHSHAAHDLWLTRNHHGCGFWDGDYEEKKGKRLTAYCDQLGELTPYEGDDGLIYFL